MKYQLTVSLLIIGFLAYYIYVAVRPPDDRTYPFSGFDMYSFILAKKPYSVHQSYEIQWPRFKLEARTPISDKANYWVLINNLHFANVNDLNTLRRMLQRIKSSLEHKNVRAFTGLQQGHSGIRFILYGPDMKFEELKDIQEIALKRMIFQIPPYPAHPKPKLVHEGLIASLTGDGKLIGVVAVNKWDDKSCRNYLEVNSSGYNNPQFRFGYILNNVDGPKPLDGVQEGGKFYYVPHEQGLYQFVIYVKDPSVGPEEYVYFNSATSAMTTSSPDPAACGAVEHIKAGM